MSTEVWSAGLQALGNVGSAIGNIISGHSANRNNLKINREQIAYDREKTQAQMDWQERMWNMENEYNTPLNQRLRYEAAGINPYFAMTNIQSGMAQSAGAAPSGGAPSQLPVQPVDYGSLGRGIAESLQQYFANRNIEANTRNVNAQAHSQEIANKFKVAEMLSNLAEKWSKVKANRGVASKAMAEARQLINDSSWISESRRMGVSEQAANINWIEQKVESEKVSQALMHSQINVNEKHALQIAQDIVESASRIAVNYATAHYMRERAKTESDVRFKLHSEAKRIVFDTYGYSNDAHLNERRVHMVERFLDSQILLNKAKTESTWQSIGRDWIDVWQKGDGSKGLPDTGYPMNGYE